MSRYYPDYTPDIGNMLLNVEANSPSLVSEYLAHFGLDRLPAPYVKENNSRAYQCWSLNGVDIDRNGTVDHYIWVDTFVPADVGGYVQALSAFWRFDQHAPEGKYTREGELIPEKKGKASATA